MLQITLASSQRRDSIVELKLVMCLQDRGDSPSNSFGTIRCISFVESDATQQPMQDKHFIANV